MKSKIVAGRSTPGTTTLSVDAVICGGGAGGSMAARELARAGLDVALLEEGADNTPPSFTQREEQMIPRIFQEMGGRRTDDLSVLILSGKGLGGSTVHNTNLCKRTAPEILSHWRDDLKIDGVGPAEMAPYFEQVEEDLGVRQIEQGRINAHNRVFQRGVEKLGYRGGVLSHNRDERCIGSGFCELGCAYDGKLNARRVLVPQALAAGAHVFVDTRVDRIVTSEGRASGVEATFLDERGQPRGRLVVRARSVCLAGSAIGSAALFLRSGLVDPHRQAGYHLRIHPASAIAGVFDETIEAWKGVPQSYECSEFLDLRPGATQRVWILPSFAHPVGFAALAPGFGPDLASNMRQYARTAALVAMVHDEAGGHVYLDGDRIRIRYAPTAADREQLALGTRQAARILFAAGAREVSIPATPPMVLRSAADVERITAERFFPHDAKLSAVHPMGSLRMGNDPRTSVVDGNGRHHQIKGLFVVDGSLFPTSIGGPPQMSIYAFAMKVARGLARALPSRDVHACPRFPPPGPAPPVVRGGRALLVIDALRGLPRVHRVRQRRQGRRGRSRGRRIGRSRSRRVRRCRRRRSRSPRSRSRRRIRQLSRGRSWRRGGERWGARGWRRGRGRRRRREWRRGRGRERRGGDDDVAGALPGPGGQDADDPGGRGGSGLDGGQADGAGGGRHVDLRGAGGG